jgi:glycosyltransferase involved in cell wall biosynthesis
MKKILITMNNLNYGGIERVVEIIYQLLHEDYNIKVAIYNVEKKELASYPFENLNCPIQKNKIKKMIFFIKRIIKTIEIKLKYKPDFTLSFGQQANYINFFTQFFGKSIINIRGYGWVEDTLFGYKIEKKMYQSVYKTIAVSQKIRMDLIEKYDIESKKIEYLYNPFDIETIKNKSEIELSENEKNYFTDGINLIAVGRIADDKGYYHLVKAMSLLKTRNINMLIIGEGPRFEDLKKLIENLKLQKNVKLLGNQSNPYKFMKYADAFILTSLREGFPNVLVEAMAVGIPVISTNCFSGPSEIIADAIVVDFKEKYKKFKYGFLIESLTDSKDYTSSNIELCDQNLADSIKSIVNDLENKELRHKMVENSKKKCKEVYNYLSFKNKLILIINDLYGENK